MTGEIAAALLAVLGAFALDDPARHAEQDRLNQLQEVREGNLREEARQERIERREQRQAEAEAAARAEEREAVAQAAPSSGLPDLLAFIRSQESSGSYGAYNATGCEGYGCGGAYQLHARYASTWAASAGYPGMSSNAATWPPATQDAVALWLFYSTNPDGAHWCRWTTYC